MLMISNISSSMKLILQAALIAMLVLSCDGPTLFPDKYVESTSGSITRREFPAEVLSRKAVAYSGYRAGQSPSTQVYPSEAQIKQDLELLIANGFGWIRLYDVSTHGERAIKVIHDHNLDLKVLLGVWISGPAATDDSANWEQINKAVELANNYRDCVVALSVGNETMVDWSFLKVPPLEMKNYITAVRSRVSQPVGTNDNFEPFTFVNELGAPYANASELAEVAAAVDFLALHTYALADPFYSEPYDIFTWDWRQEAVAEGTARAVAMMDAALAYAKKNIRDARSALTARGIEVPIFIGETGWTDTGKFLDNGANPVNQKMYYDRLQDWVYGAGKDADSPLGVFYFEAFDEPWKGDDDNWGLFTVDRAPKYVLSGTGYTMDDAFWYKTSTAVSSSTYWLYGNGAPTADVTLRSVWTGWKWSAWENGVTASAAPVANGNEEGTGEAVRITPSTLSWGWGMAMAATQGVDNNARENLSLFSGGHLRFNIKSAYPGVIEIGFRGTKDVYISVNPAANSFGYANDNQWHEVAIPVASLLALSGITPGELAVVADTFVIANRYGITGNTPASGGTSPFFIDRVRWTRD